MLTFLILVLVILAPAASAQNWVKPMPDNPMLLSANFAEIRPSHLHSGIDIKTGGVEGSRVVASRDGYISRIGVKPYGYGRVLYITHDDGSVSVYAHLSRFIPSLEEYLKKKRYQLEENDVDLFPEKNLFRFRAGELIAYSGNSGSSGGPHLHFEIRRGAAQKPINILHEGIFKVTDNIRPIISALHFFAVDTIDGVQLERKVATYKPVSVGGGRYRFQSELKLPGKGYFAVEVTDRKDGTSNTMGVYSVLLLADGTPRYQLALDDFGFDETRCVNSLSVYSMQRKSRNEIFRLVRRKGDAFSGLADMKRNGIIDPSRCRDIDIEILDDADNLSLLSFAVVYDSLSTPLEFSRPAGSTKMVCKKPGKLSCGPFSVDIRANSLFDDCFMTARVLEVQPPQSAVSEIYSFADEDTPFFTNVSVSIKSDRFLPGTVIARYNPVTGGLSSLGGNISGGTISASVPAGGCFCLVRDTVPPKIVPIFPKGFTWASSKSVSFKMSDSFSGVSTYSLKIDGRFAILEHVMKKATLIHKFDNERFGSGKKHTLELTITDGAGNRTVYTKTYTR